MWPMHKCITGFTINEGFCNILRLVGWEIVILICEICLGSRTFPRPRAPTNYRLLEEPKYMMASYGYCFCIRGAQLGFRRDVRKPSQPGYWNLSVATSSDSRSLKSFGYPYARFESHPCFFISTRSTDGHSEETER